MKEGIEFGIWSGNLVFVSVGAKLVSVHAHHGDLDWSCEVEVVVAQVISRGLELLLVHASGVIN